MRNSKIKGFTLIELIVVIAIIGVLAAILVPSMMGFVKDSKFSTANSNAKLVHTNLSTWATKCETAGYPMGTGCSQATALAIPARGTAPSPNGTQTAATAATALGYYMGTENAGGAGYAAWTIDASGAPVKTWWAKTSVDPIVGRYPDPTDVNNTCAFGG